MSASSIERVAEDYLKVYRALPGVRRAIRRIAPFHKAQLARFGAPLPLEPSSFPGLQQLGSAQVTPTE